MWKQVAALMLIVTASSLLLAPLEARGERGGGGGRGGNRGAYQGGRTMNRTPTMSRAANRPAASQGRMQQPRQATGQRPSAANRAELRNEVNRYAQNRPAQNIDRQALGQRTQDFTRNRSQQVAQNRQLSDRTSQRLRDSHPNYNHWFDRNFFDRHNIGLGYVGDGANWWRPAAWASLATWGAWNWSTPYYYDDGGYSYPLTTTTESTYSYPSTSQTPAPPSGDWLPLGVFAVAHNADAAANTNRFIQLALNRSGEIAGVYYNSSTDAAKDLTGMVDQTTQKAYWSMANQPGSPIASTGIYNLTEAKTPINVHFSDGSDQTWILVRLQE